MVNSLENIDKSKVYASRIEGLDQAIADEVENSTDNITITSNLSTNKIQTIGIINQNSGSPALKSWSGTSSQYNSILSKDANTLYNITDDSDVSLTILETLYPVGSIYITTNETCPLAVLISGSTWIKEATGVITGLSETAPCKGNGLTLGLTNGTVNGGVGLSNQNILYPYTGLYGKNVGDTTISGFATVNNSYGITTDPDNSGIITDLSSVATSYSVNLFRRTL